MQEIVKQAVKALKISVPIYRADVQGNKVTLWLYNRRKPVTWTRPAAKKKAAAKKKTAAKK